MLGGRRVRWRVVTDVSARNHRFEIILEKWVRLVELVSIPFMGGTLAYERPSVFKGKSLDIDKNPHCEISPMRVTGEERWDRKW